MLRGNLPNHNSRRSCPVQPCVPSPASPLQCLEMSENVRSAYCAFISPPISPHSSPLNPSESTRIHQFPPPPSPSATFPDALPPNATCPCLRGSLPSPFSVQRS